MVAGYKHWRSELDASDSLSTIIPIVEGALSSAKGIDRKWAKRHRDRKSRHVRIAIPASTFIGADRGHVDRRRVSLRIAVSAWSDKPGRKDTGREMHT